MKFAITLTDDERDIAILKDFTTPLDRAEVSRFITELELAKLELLVLFESFDDLEEED